VNIPYISEEIVMMFVNEIAEDHKATVKEFKEIAISEIIDGDADFIEWEDCSQREQMEITDLMNTYEVPALLVEEIEGGYYLVDGFHRLIAAKQLEMETVLVAIKNFHLTKEGNDDEREKTQSK